MKKILVDNRQTARVPIRSALNAQEHPKHKLTSKRTWRDKITHCRKKYTSYGHQNLCVYLAISENAIPGLFEVCTHIGVDYFMVECGVFSIYDSAADAFFCLYNERHGAMDVAAQANCT